MNVQGRWHMWALVGLILLVSTTGLILRPPEVAGTSVGSRLAADAAIVVVQCALVLYVLWGDGGVTRPRGPAIVDVVLAVVLVALVEGLGFAVTRLFPYLPAPPVLPRTLAERMAWVVVATTVGVGEEVVYRGYLLRRLGAFARSGPAGVVLQAMLFGFAHANQGLRAVEVGLDGLLFGWVAYRRGSLYAVILAHVAIDLWSGLARA